MKSVKTAWKNKKKSKKKLSNPKKAVRKQQMQKSDQPIIPTLRFTPYAWAKLLFLRDYGNSEVGGFGITSADNLLLVENIQLIRQHCTVATVKFEDESIADFFDEQVEQGRKPEQFARIWIHTHPGNCADPSGVDEETFVRSFGSVDWAVMFILARSGTTYSRLRFNIGPGGETEVPVQVDCSTDFAASNQVAWEQEYLEQVTITDDWFFPDSEEIIDDDPYGLHSYYEEEFQQPAETGFLDNFNEEELF
jgi:proteasome lid subunit RPN8/RPN11